MPVTLLISQHHNQRRVARLKDGQTIDIDLEWSSSPVVNFSPLDQIYWGRVLQVKPAHAFVKLAENQVGLLPFEPPFSRPNEGQAILIQVRREAIPDKGTRHKGPLLTRKIMFGGRYCLYHPFQEKRFLSSKIQDPATRKRLQALLPVSEPVTFRESAAHAPVDHIHTEIAALRQKFLEIQALSTKAPCFTPYDALPSSHRWMRDLEVSEGNKILVDHNQALTDIRNFLQTCRPDLLPYVQKHTLPLFEACGIEEFWASLFQDVIDLPNGGNIVIDLTTAAIIIDVNSGDKDARETNKEAVLPIIQHLKGRHLGGNILIDFMGVEASPQDRTCLTNLLFKHASDYYLPLDILGWSKLGWLEARLPRRRIPLRERVNLYPPFSVIKMLPV